MQISQVVEVGLEWVVQALVVVVRAQVVERVASLALAWAVEGHLQELVVELEVALAQVGVAVQE